MELTMSLLDFIILAIINVIFIITLLNRWYAKRGAAELWANMSDYLNFVTVQLRNAPLLEMPLEERNRYVARKLRKGIGIYAATRQPNFVTFLHREAIHAEQVDRLTSDPFGPEIL